MSSCIIIQQNKKCYMCADSAVSCTLDGENFRVGDDAEKIFKHDNSIIFCSGNMTIATHMINYIKQLTDISIENIVKKIKDIYIAEKGMFEIFIAKLDRDSTIKTYQISSYNNFKPIIRKTNKGSTNILAVGFKVDKALDSVKQNIGKHNSIEDMFKQIFDDIKCPEIGGMISLFEISDKHNKNILNYKLKEGLYKPFTKKGTNKHLVIAETIMGEAILGEKMTISNPENTIRLDGDGLSIYDSLGILRCRMGLYEMDGIKKASLLLMSKDGQRVLISEDGLSGNDSLMNEQNCDSSHPMYFPVDIPENIREIRSAKLYLHFSKYRADFRSLAGGGSSHSSSTSSSGGGVSTTTASGGGISTSTASGGGTVKVSSQRLVNSNGETIVPIVESREMLGEITGLLPEHGHSVNLPSHQHNFSLNSHQHSINIPNHTHNFSLSINSHTHPIEWGIYESTFPSKVSVYVNNVRIKENINGDSVVDITEHLKLNQLNKIEVTTATNGRINALLSMTTFSSF